VDAPIWSVFLFWRTRSGLCPVYSTKGGVGVKRWMGLLLAFVLFGWPRGAAASCFAASPAQHLATAQAVVYGRVSAVDQRPDETFYIVDLERVYKGQPRNPVVVHTNSGSRQITSVDMPLSNGVDYTLYLRADKDEYWTTDICTGSHEGKPAGEEAGLLGEGQAAPALEALPTESPWFPFRYWVPFVALAVAVGGMLAVLLSIRRRSRQG